MQILKPLAFYCGILAIVLTTAGVAVHFLIAREYRLNLAANVSIIAHNGEEAVEGTPSGQPLEPALARVLGAPDEGLVWFDTDQRPVAKAGMTATENAVVERTRVDDEGANGWIQATISRDRIARELRSLDLGLLFGITIATIAGGLIITWFSRRALTRVETALLRVHRFTSDAAHELRGPLAVISNNADHLAFGSDERGRDRNLANIRQAAWQMQVLMNGLLLLARADEDVTGDLHAIDLRACIERLADAHRDDAVARGLRLRVTGSEGLTVYGRPEQVPRIIGNLIENALRYTPPNGTIDVSWRSDRKAAVIDIADSGVGIAPENLERIFDRFWRADGVRTGDGAGLGLAIARSLARAHGGDVTVSSRLGLGSTFTVRLPLLPQRVAALSTRS